LQEDILQIRSSKRQADQVRDVWHVQQMHCDPACTEVVRLMPAALLQRQQRLGAATQMFDT
jgi:hypothetical protein